MKNLEELQTFHRYIEPHLELRLLSKEEFQTLWNEHYPVVFAANSRLDLPSILSQAELDQMTQLSEFMGSPLCLRFGLFEHGRFVGWHVGDQKSREEFYMRNSGVIPELQGRGLYTKMLKCILAQLKSIGFQVISSKHNATNNRIIIPKLRAGFVITGLELSDKFGTLVRLEYFTNDMRRSVMDYRCGQALPSDSLKPILGL